MSGLYTCEAALPGFSDSDPGTWVTGTKSGIFGSLCDCIFIISNWTYGSKDYRGSSLATHVLYIRPIDILNNVVGEMLKILLL